MLSSEHRLRKKRDFEAIFKAGASAGNKSLVMRFKKTDANQPARIGIIISKKTEKLAVKRNRARRQLAEILRTLYIPELKGYDIVFIVKSGFIQSHALQQRGSVAHLLKQANLL